MKTVQSPTRDSSWKLFRLAAILIVIHFVIIAIQFIIILGTFGDALEEWREDREAGDYTVTTTDGNEYKHKHKKEHDSDDDDENRQFEDDFAEGYSAFIFMIIITGFSIACCIMSCCAMLTLG